VSSTECPCGRARAGCTYHDPALQSAHLVVVRAEAGPVTRLATYTVQVLP
jgi:hypothetical protein